MSKIIFLTDIPEESVDTVLGDFESEGATAERKLQDNGLWTIRASFGAVLGDAGNISPFPHQQMKEYRQLREG